MKIYNTGIKFLFLLTAIFFIAFSSCQKAEDNNDLTADLVGNYIGEYREGDGGFTVIVSNVASTITKKTDNELEMDMELVAGLVVVSFTAEMISDNSFSINVFDLDGDQLEGEGTLENNLLNISFYEKGTTKTYASYIAEKQ